MLAITLVCRCQSECSFNQNDLTYKVENVLFEPMSNNHLKKIPINANINTGIVCHGIVQIINTKTDI